MSREIAKKHKKDKRKERSPYATKYNPIKVGSIDGTDKIAHDKAILRACNSIYYPDKRLHGKAKKTIFVGRLHPKVNDQELKHIFSEFGSVRKCKVVKNLVTGHSKRYGFVEYEKERYADRAFRYANKTVVRGAEIIVDWEMGRVMKGWKPRSLGGGFGGKRESGQLRFGCRDRPWKMPITIDKKHDDRAT